MRELILEFPKQIEEGFEAGGSIKIQGKFNKILICGMGGSALAGEILKIFFREKKIKIKILIHRNYDLPEDIDKNTLIFTISYSGNTEETISALKEAIRKKCRVLGISSGGELEKVCKKFKIPFVKVREGLPPRMAIGVLFSAVLKVLINSKIVKDFSKEILSLERKLKPEILEKEGKKLAKKIKGGILRIYCPEEWEGLARIWKLNLDETAKIPAFFNLFPELNHGEIQSFESFKNFHAIFFFDKKSHPRILKREIITSEILKKKGVKVNFIFLNEKKVLEKIFSKILLAFWFSYYLAIFRKKNPFSTEIIAELKRKMKN